MTHPSIMIEKLKREKASADVVFAFLQEMWDQLVPSWETEWTQRLEATQAKKRIEELEGIVAGLRADLAGTERELSSMRAMRTGMRIDLPRVENGGGEHAHSDT